jgi:hypothetical protein
MAIDNVQELLEEQLGKRKFDVVTTTAMTSKNYYCIHFLADSVVTTLTCPEAQSGTGSTPASLERTYTAGTTLFLNVTEIDMSSGLAIFYYEQNY